MNSKADTREKLIQAAEVIFNADGFEGTNSNKIAERAGFAPQTFYRHFKDKTEIFLSVYARWSFEEDRALSPLIDQNVTDWKENAYHATNFLIRHHSDWQVFRKSLRILSISNPDVRRIRSASRHRQASKLVGLPQHKAIQLILEVEALCDAYVDGVTDELNVSEVDWRETIEDRIQDALRVNAISSD